MAPDAQPALQLTPADCEVGLSLDDDDQDCDFSHDPMRPEDRAWSELVLALEQIDELGLDKASPRAAVRRLPERLSECPLLTRGRTDTDVHF